MAIEPPGNANDVVGILAVLTVFMRRKK